MTVRQCNRLAVRGHRSEDIKFIKVYVYFNAHIVCFGFFSGSAEADSRCSSRLIGSCVKNVCTKNY